MEQEIFDKQEETPKGIPAFASILGYLVAFLVLGGLFSVLAYVILGFPSESMFQLWQHLVIQAVTLPAAVLPALFMLKFFDHRPLSDLGLGIKGRGKDILLGILMAILLYGIGFGLSLLSGAVEITGFHLDIESLVASFGLFILVAFTEEIMVRGYILGRLLRTGMNKFLALLISSVIFALMHIFNPSVTFLPMLNLVLAGCLLGVSYLYTRNLWFPISLHLFWNWIQGPVLGYEVSGNVLCPSLLQLHLPNDNLLNGGAFGFEGSIICTILMLLFIGGVIWYFERKQKTFS